MSAKIDESIIASRDLGESPFAEVTEKSSSTQAVPVDAARIVASKTGQHPSALLRTHQQLSSGLVALARDEFEAGSWLEDLATLRAAAG